MTPAAQLVELLGLTRQPVAIAFLDSAPAAVPRIDTTAASGCTYWKYAAGGQVFYTEASDHYGCPVGSHTHGIDLPEDKAKELEGLLGTMVQLHYINMDEVPRIAQLDQPFGVAVYAPLAESPVEPDVVLVSGNARQMMLLAEAAHSAGVDCETDMMGRPTCAAIPAVMKSARSATNLGCIGNRVYTELKDDELYFVIPGSHVERVVEKLVVIARANDELEQFHRARIVCA